MAGKAQGKGPRSASGVDLEIGARIRACRLEQGVSQESLAASIGVTFQQIQKYEKGANRVAAATLLRIAEALDTDIRLLLPKQTKVGEGGEIYEADVAKAAHVLSQLNREGRRIALRLLKALVGDAKLKR